MNNKSLRFTCLWLAAASIGLDLRKMPELLFTWRVDIIIYFSSDTFSRLFANSFQRSNDCLIKSYMICRKLRADDDIASPFRTAADTGAHRR